VKGKNGKNDFAIKRTTDNVLHHSVELNRYIMLGPENDKQKVLFI
jgi:hypothetical protein